jgi:hypothetical protein
MFNGIQKYFRNVEELESIRVQAYSQGQEDAASRFMAQQKAMTNKIEELSAQNISTEKRLRVSADSRINTLESLHDAKCNSCRRNLEEERQRLLRRQSQLAEKIAKFDEVWMNLYQHATSIIDEHDVLIRSSGRLVASRNILLDFRRQVDTIMEEAAPLLSIELHDSAADKNIDLTPSQLTESEKNGKYRKKQ